MAKKKELTPEELEQQADALLAAAEAEEKKAAEEKAAKEEEKKAPACACNCGCPTSEAEEIKNDCCPEAKDGICCIKVLGSGCKSCHALLEATKEAVQNMGLSIEVEYVTDMAKIMEYGVMSMPALVVNEKVVSMGKVLKTADVEKLLHKLGF